MGMIKEIDPAAYDFDAPISRMIGVSSRGLRGSDLSVMIKRAGVLFADKIRKMEFSPGEVPIHMIALGATELYGCNRNGDGFSKYACQKYHDTFVKHARFYRNHINKDQKKSYGIIKASSYNEEMHRVELIVALNGTKEAAEKNGGLVADRELEKIESGDENWAV